MDLGLELELTQPEKIVKEKKPKLKRLKKEGTDGNFINNSSLFPEVVKCKETMIVSKELARMIMLMATRYCSAKNFAHLPFKEDMIQACILSLYLNILKFNPEKGTNVFSYGTTILYHSCLQMIATENKQKNIKNQLIVDSGVNASLGFMEAEHDRYREENKDFFQHE